MAESGDLNPFGTSLLGSLLGINPEYDEGFDEGYEVDATRFGADYMNQGVMPFVSGTSKQMGGGDLRPDYMIARDERRPFNDNDTAFLGMGREDSAGDTAPTRMIAPTRAPVALEGASMWSFDRAKAFNTARDAFADRIASYDMMAEELVRQGQFDSIADARRAVYNHPEVEMDLRYGLRQAARSMPAVRKFSASGLAPEDRERIVAEQAGGTGAGIGTYDESLRGIADYLRAAGLSDEGIRGIYTKALGMDPDIVGETLGIARPTAFAPPSDGAIARRLKGETTF